MLISDVKRAEKAENIQAFRRQISEYAMAFDLLKKVVSADSEQIVIQRIIEVFEILFSPQEVLCLSLQKMSPGKLYSSIWKKNNQDADIMRLSKLEGLYSWTESQDGFRVKISYNQREVAIIEVQGLALPEHKEHYLNLTLSIIDVCGLAIVNARRYQKLKDAESCIRNEKEKLEEALSEVKALTGLLPICGHCKKIRDDQGYWNQIEGYIQAHSEAKFSHSICEECAKKHYPGYDIY